MDYAHAKNYWRMVFVNDSEGRFDNDDFDKWFPCQPGHGGFQDAIFEAFVAMLEACAEGKFERRGRA